MKEKPNISVEKGEAFRASPTDLPKALGCLDHELLISKVNANGFNLTALKLIHDYLSNRNKRTNLNSSYTGKCKIILERVP